MNNFQKILYPDNQATMPTLPSSATPFSNMFHLCKKAVKSILGRDLWIRPNLSQPWEFHGSEYGGWAIIDNSLDPESVVYSFGIGEDASFDLSLIQKYGCVVHGFDPTPKSVNWVEKTVTEARFKLLPWALADYDGDLELWLPANENHVSATLRKSSDTSNHAFKAPCHKLSSVMQSLGHPHIHVLKMDIEGAEYGVLKNLADEAVFERIDQILIEFHHWMPSFTLDDTRMAISLLGAHGFRIPWVSRSGHEILFTKSP